MNIADLLSEQLVCFPLISTTRNDAIDEMVRLCQKAGYVSDPVAFTASLMDRELVRHTVIYPDVCVPRCSCNAVTSSFVAIGLLQDPIMWNVQAPTTVKLIVVFAHKAPRDSVFLNYLVAIAKVLSVPQKRESLMLATDTADLFNRAIAIFH